MRRAASCPAEHRGVTFAGCDVENWIQVWSGVCRRRGGGQGIKGEGGILAREKEGNYVKRGLAWETQKRE